MSRVELEILGDSAIQSAAPTARVRVIRGIQFSGSRGLAPLDITPLSVNSATPVQDQGLELYQRLSSHQPVDQALQPLTQLTTDTQPLYLHIVDDTGATSALPWEMLYFSSKFLALQRSRAVARVAEPDDPVTPQLTLDPRVRVMSILSMLGAPAEDEWRAIQDRMEATRSAFQNGQTGMNPHHNIQVGELDLYNTIKPVADQSRDITLNMIPGQVTDLLDAITDYKPQVLHLYCHGDLDERLHLASQVDWHAHDPANPSGDHGSLHLSLDDLALAARSAGVWLVVVNACLGANAMNAESMVERLVRAGVPAAIGHRLLIQPIEANRLSHGLYKELFDVFAAAIDNGQDPQQRRQHIEWASLLTRARQDSANGVDPAVDEDWSVPIMQVSATDFEVEVTDIPQSDDSQAASESLGLEVTMDGAIAAIVDRPDTPDEVVAMLRELSEMRVREPVLAE